MSSLHRLDLIKANPPTQYVADELCDRCGVNDLGDTAVKVKDPRYPGRRAYYCLECAETVERCDQCGFYRCNCP
jgi:hypothetical protein